MVRTASFNACNVIGGPNKAWSTPFVSLPAGGVTVVGTTTVGHSRKVQPITISVMWLGLSGSSQSEVGSDSQIRNPGPFDSAPLVTSTAGLLRPPLPDVFAMMVTSFCENCGNNVVIREPISDLSWSSLAVPATTRCLFLLTILRRSVQFYR